MKEPSSREIFGYVKDLYELGIKRPGTESGVAAEDYIVRKLSAFEYTISSDEIPVGVFEYDTAQLEVGSDSIALYPYVPSPFTGSSGLKRVLAYERNILDDNFTGSDLNGALLLSSIPYGQFRYDDLLNIAVGYHASAEGLRGIVQEVTWNTGAEVQFLTATAEMNASGVIGIYPSLNASFLNGALEKGFQQLCDIPEQQITPFLYNPLADIMEARPGPTPAAGVGPVAGTFLIDIAEEGAEVTFVLEGKQRSGKTRNIAVELPGESDRFIIIGVHHDTMWSGAVEDCSGCGVVLALARYYREMGVKLPVGLRFVFFAAEQYRDLGVREYIRKRRTELAEKLVVDIHVEHIGIEASLLESGELGLTGELQPRAFFVTPDCGFEEMIMAIVRDHDMERTVVMNTDTPLGVPTDACPMNEAGFPVISFISAPLYWNAAEDTLDKVPYDELSRVSAAMIDIIDRLMQRERR